MFPIWHNFHVIPTPKGYITKYQSATSYLTLSENTLMKQLFRRHQLINKTIRRNGEKSLS